MPKYLVDTQFAQTADMKYQMQQVIKYLILNRGVVIPEGQLSQIFQTKPIMASILNKLFEQCINTGYIREFASILPLVVRGEPKTNLPDLLTMRNMTLDLKHNIDARPLESYYELKDKILINLSELVKMDPVHRSAQVSDLNEMHSMYVRGLLVRSYSQSDGWLNPSLCTYIIQTYCMAISSIIARNENLHVTDQMTVASIFALYMAQMLSPKDENMAKPALYYRCTFLGNMRELDVIAGKVAHVSGNGLTISSVCELIAELGPARLQKFNAGLFYRTCSSLGASTDVISTHIAFEYPPYWVLMLIRALDGMKMGSLFMQLKQSNLVNPGKTFAHSLITCKPLFESK
jgi:hypothetical protein